ncbi:MAG: hypothetical protein RR293_04985 [Bacteroidales bacterium]
MMFNGVNIAVISRSTEQSPNLSSADDMIIRSVLERLRAYQANVELYSEAEFLTHNIKHDIIVNMCRKESSLLKLQYLEDNGALVINSGYSIMSCTRRKLVRVFKQINIPAPQSVIVETNAGELPFCGEFHTCWLKLPDNNTLIFEDIVFVKTIDEYKKALSAYAERGVKEVIVSEHIHGDLVKFYSVPKSDFLFTFYPILSGHSKFGYEKNNDPIQSIPFSRGRLLEICRLASEATGISVLGGDCIITGDGEPIIIDLNDWPSFSSCTQEASESIVRMIAGKIKDR